MTHALRADSSTPRTLTVFAITVWLVAAIAAGVSGLVNTPGQPPFFLMGFVGVPILSGVAAYALSPAFRAWTGRLSLTWLVGLHLWRFVGLGFVLGWLFGKLPGGFAIPEGLGDIVAAAGALALLPSLRRGTASRTWLLVWNTFGLIDLVSAIIVGSCTSNGALGVLSRGGVTTEPMVLFPVSLIPTFFVPLFILIHLLTFARLSSRHAVSDATDAGRRTAHAWGGGRPSDGWPERTILLARLRVHHAVSFPEQIFRLMSGFSGGTPDVRR